MTGRARRLMLRHLLPVCLLAGIVVVPSTTPAAQAAAVPAPGKLVFGNADGIWTSDSDGGNRRLVIPPIGADYPTEPSWSNDGTMISYVWGPNSPDRRTWVANADGTGARFLTLGRYGMWTPDDRRVLYFDGSSEHGIGYAEVDGSGEGKLVPFLTGGPGDLSPDGSRLAFVRIANGIGRIYLIDTDGTDMVRLTDGSLGSDGMQVRWSPDGERLLFSTFLPDGRSEITVIKADGTGRRMIRRDAWAWDWSPDGTQVLFHDRTNESALTRDNTLWRMQADGSGAAPLPGLDAVWGVDWFAPNVGAASASAGGVHTLSLGVDNRVRAHGSNGLGQLGIGVPAGASTPAVVPALGPAQQVAGGVLHSLAVLDGGTVRAWGWNVYGQLGDGTATDRRQPTAVPGLPAIESVAAGLYHSLAVAGDGSVWAWGWNALGQLGDGTTVDRRTPVRVPGLNDVVAVSAGAYHSLALRSDGSLWAWGYNGQGELGTGDLVDVHQPTLITDLGPVTSVSAGLYHSLAVRTDGTVWAWGWNGYGQLGTGDKVDATSPVSVGALGPATSVAAGGLHSLALLADGSVRAWGFNGVGQLGDETTAERLAPVEVAHLGYVTGVTAGLLHSVAVVAPGALWAWGSNELGQLGTGTPSVTRLRAKVRT